MAHGLLYACMLHIQQQSLTSGCTCTGSKHRDWRDKTEHGDTSPKSRAASLPRGHATPPGRRRVQRRRCRRGLKKLSDGAGVFPTHYCTPRSGDRTAPLENHTNARACTNSSKQLLRGSSQTSQSAWPSRRVLADLCQTEHERCMHCCHMRASSTRTSAMHLTPPCSPD